VGVSGLAVEGVSDMDPSEIDVILSWLSSFFIVGLEGDKTGLGDGCSSSSRLFFLGLGDPLPLLVPLLPLRERLES